MKIVNIIGGLGNQMFQYAFAIVLKSENPFEKVLIDTSHFHYLFFNHWRGSHLHNGYEIDIIFPNANLKHASFFQLIKVTWFVPNYVISRIVRKLFPLRKTEIIQKRHDIFRYQPEVLSIHGNRYYEGNWESVNYYIKYRNLIQNIFSHDKPDVENSQYIEMIKSTESVGIHIRRGDYLKYPKYQGICTLEYYKKAIDDIILDGKSHIFYIFSNDISWCEKNIKQLVQGQSVIMINNNKGNLSYWDMFLMTYCKDLIIANSSFSWWGAFLNNRNGRVYAPQRWINEDRVFDIWMPEWKKI